MDDGRILNGKNGISKELFRKGSSWTERRTARHCPWTVLFYKNVDGRHIAKNLHFATSSTSQMRDRLGMIPVKYEKIQSKTVGCERILREKFTEYMRK